MPKSKKVQLNSMILVNATLANEFQSKCFTDAIRIAVTAVGQFYNTTHQKNAIAISMDGAVIVEPEKT